MGICLTLEFDEEIEISFYGTQPEYSIFVTDPSHSTHFNLDLNSHKGSKIRMEKNALKNPVNKFYNIQIEILSNSKENNLCNSTKDYSYMKCVDDTVQEQMSKVNH